MVNIFATLVFHYYPESTNFKNIKWIHIFQTELKNIQAWSWTQDVWLKLLTFCLLIYLNVQAADSINLDNRIGSEILYAVETAQ